MSSVANEFSSLHGNEWYEACDDEARRRRLMGAGTEKQDSEKTQQISEGIMILTSISALQ